MPLVVNAESGRAPRAAHNVAAMQCAWRLAALRDLTTRADGVLFAAMSRSAKPRATSASHAEKMLDDLPFYLARLQLNFRRLGDRTLREEGLGPQPPGIGSVLHALLEKDDCLVGSLVQRTHLPNGTVTGILDRLEADRLIVRVDDAEDGRAWRVRLTARGEALRPKLLRRHARVMEVVRTALTDSEIATFKKLADRLTEAMQSYHQKKTAGKSFVARRVIA